MHWLYAMYNFNSEACGNEEDQNSLCPPKEDMKTILYDFIWYYEEKEKRGKAMFVWEGNVQGGTSAMEPEMVAGNPKK